MMRRHSAIPMKNTSAWVYRDVRLQRHSASAQMRTGVHTLGLTLQQHHSGLCNKGREDHLHAMQHDME